jgi:hypothetical protein
MLVLNDSSPGDFREFPREPAPAGERQPRHALLALDLVGRYVWYVYYNTKLGLTSAGRPLSGRTEGRHSAGGRAKA